MVEWGSLRWSQEFVEMGRKQVLELYPSGRGLRVIAGLDRES